MLLLAATMALAIGVAACGSSDDDSSDSGSTGDTAAKTKDATLVLDFIPGAVHSGIYEALQKGYYEDNGINLKIIEPTSTADTLKLIDAGKATERDFADIAVRSRRDAMQNPNAQVKGEFDAKKILKDEPYLSSPLRKSLCPPVTDGAACVILASGDKARSLCKRPAFIRGIDHRVEAHQLGLRDLTQSPSARLAGERAGVGKAKVDVAELHAPFAHQEIILKQALGLDDSVTINPSGGALAANSIMTAGLIRFGEAAARIMDGSAKRAVAHCTSGPCLQQNLVCVLEGEN